MEHVVLGEVKDAEDNEICRRYKDQYAFKLYHWVLMNNQGNSLYQFDISIQYENRPEIPSPQIPKLKADGFVIDHLSSFHRKSYGDQCFILFRVELVCHAPAVVIQDIFDQLEDQLRGLFFLVG